MLVMVNSKCFQFEKLHPCSFSPKFLPGCQNGMIGDRTHTTLYEGNKSDSSVYDQVPCNK